MRYSVPEMKDILNLYKARGETPLERIERFRKENPEYKNVPLSYAGRLDPMAEGVLVVLAGEANKRRTEYLNLDKEYTFDVLFGFSTDTYDVLGVMADAVTRTSHKQVKAPLLSEYLAQLPGVHSQKYPPFSSKPLEGVPLFVKARKGELTHFQLPEHQIEIFSTALVGMKRITDTELLAEVERVIKLVRGDFRQERILHLWRDTLRVLYGTSFDVATISIHCSSGTYVRSIAQELGERLGIPALAMRILRTRAGTFKVRQSRK
jgi:tRNA pseudouridine55 synthase